jgi:hypothetical protein
MLNDAGIRLLSSAEYRIGGKAAARNIVVFKDRAVRIAGLRSLSALTISAASVAQLAASATSAVAIFTSVSTTSLRRLDATACGQLGCKYHAKASRLWSNGLPREAVFVGHPAGRGSTEATWLVYDTVVVNPWW